MAIRSDWLALLDDEAKGERECLGFLQSHAGFFFPQNWTREDLVISELQLGADYRTDFVGVGSNRSYGFVYTLIEIESPHIEPFTRDGNPSARLSHALQQVRDWQRWIDNHRDEALRLFPSKRARILDDVHFDYLVIIGRREGARHVGRRNQLGDVESVKIRSFDYLTDLFDARLFASFTDPSYDISPLESELDNRFSNPFYCAYSDVEWRSIVDDAGLDLSHMVTTNINTLLSNRRYNRERLEEFLNYLETLPTDERVPAPGEFPPY